MWRYVGRVEGIDVGRGEVSREGMGEWKGYVVKREQMKRDIQGERKRESGGVSREEEREREEFSCSRRQNTN